MFATGMGPVADSAFAITSMLIAIPTGIKIFSWIATVWGGSLRMTTAFYFALGVVLEFTIGGLSGIMHASAPIDLQQTDSYFVVAHFHYVLFGGMMFAILGGVLLLVAQNDRPDAQRGPRQAALLADHHWLQRHLFSDALSRRMGDAAAHLYLRAGMGWDFWNAFETGCAYLLFISFADFRLQPHPEPQPRRKGRGRSLGRPHPGVGDSVAAAPLQF